MPVEQRLEGPRVCQGLKPRFLGAECGQDHHRARSAHLTPERLTRGPATLRGCECLPVTASAVAVMDHPRRRSRTIRKPADRRDGSNRPSASRTALGQKDVYRTLVTGLAGTPMPSYATSLEPDQAWDLAYYVLSLSRSGRTAEAGSR